MSAFVPPLDQLAPRLERLAGRTLVALTTPGGPRRPVLRAQFDSGPNWILVKRAPDRALRENTSLDCLAAAPDGLAPKRIGEIAGWQIQSDLGPERVSSVLHATPRTARWEVLAQALHAVFDLHDIANAAPSLARLPLVDLDTDALLHIAKGPRRTARWYKIDPLPEMEFDALLPWLGTDTPRFIKSDSRLANMVRAPSGQFGCVDFEFSGRRHGSEDIATLLCSEAMPVELDAHLDALDALITARCPGDTARDKTKWLKTFHIQAALQAGTRLRVIAHDLRKSGWADYADILKLDLVGTHPVLVSRIAQRGAMFADLHRETRPMVALYRRIAAQVAEAGPPGA